MVRSVLPKELAQFYLSSEITSDFSLERYSIVVTVLIATYDNRAHSIPEQVVGSHLEHL